MGPYSLDGLHYAPITPDTMVWKTGMSDWVKAGTLPELQSLLTDKSRSDSLEEPPQKSGDISQQNIHITNTFQTHYPAPPNHLTEAIIVTIISALCCCSPVSVVLGIIAIVSANKVDTLASQGYREQATAESNKAQKMIYWAAGISIIWWIVTFIINLTTSIFSNLL